MSIGAIIVLVTAGCAWWWYASPTAATPEHAQVSQEVTQETGQIPAPVVATTTSGTPATPVQQASGYTMADVQGHNSASSCWSVVDGQVYNLTAWIGRHPGGAEAIESMCGKDGSAAFHGQHGMNRKEAQILETMRLGALAR